VTLDGNPSPIPYTGDGRFQHCKELSMMFFGNGFEWHDWSDDVVRLVSENPLAAITGCGTSGKSTGVADEIFWWWLCDYLNSAVIIVSTTLDSSKKRIWKEVSRLYGLFSRAGGGFREATIGSSPRPYISPYKPDEPTKRDEAHGLYVTALQKKSDVDKEMEYIKGFHPRRIAVVVDEMDSLREHGKAVWEVFVSNLSSGATEAKFVALGNDPSLFNQLGELMQPAKGQPVTMANKRWDSIHGLACLRLDAWDSPNIRDDNKWTGLIRQSDIDRIIKLKGENSPAVWIMLHGLHPPEGAESTVLSEAMFVRFHCRDGVIWFRNYISCALLDPAYGGDNCCIRRMDYGLDVNMQMKVLFHDPVHLTINAGLRDSPEEYQVAEQSMEFAKRYGILPENFIGDSTGTTGGALAVLRREWSPNVNECSFAGLPSDYPVSEDNPVPAKQEYDRKVTEIYFRFREYVEADMVRGLDNVTAAQFCSRLFTIRNRKTVLEKKEDMKGRGLASPDESDCTALGPELLVRKGVYASIRTEVKQAHQDGLEREVEEQDFDSRSDCYQEDFEVEEFA
jgi:hypothetical protein